MENEKNNGDKEVTAVKIGARNLTEKALKILLPQCEQIEAEIEHMRENAKLYNKNLVNVKKDWRGILDKEYKNNVNNVISILGARGSGKTSVLLTLKHKLDLGYYGDEDKKKSISVNPKDIIMPTILPETMGDNSDLLGWILGGFRMIVDAIEKEIEHKSDNYDEKFKKSISKIVASTRRIRFVKHTIMC